MPASGGVHRENPRSVRSRAQQVVKYAAGFYDRVRPEGRGVVVLAYHRVGGRCAAQEIDLPTDRFEAQIERLTDARCRRRRSTMP